MFVIHINYVIIPTQTANVFFFPKPNVPVWKRSGTPVAGTLQQTGCFVTCSGGIQSFGYEDLFARKGTKEVVFRKSWEIWAVSEVQWGLNLSACICGVSSRNSESKRFSTYTHPLSYVIMCMCTGCVRSIYWCVWLGLHIHVHTRAHGSHIKKAMHSPPSHPCHLLPHVIYGCVGALRLHPTYLHSL